MPTGTRTGPQIGSLTRKKRRQRFFPSQGKSRTRANQTQGSRPRPPRRGRIDHTTTLYRQTHWHTHRRPRETLPRRFGGLAARFWPAAQLKSGPAPATTASETAAGRLGHRTGMPAAPGAATPASAAASRRQRSWKGSVDLQSGRHSHLAAVRTPVFSEVKRTIHLFLYDDFVLLYDNFDCNIRFGPVIRHEYCFTFAW